MPFTRRTLTPVEQARPCPWCDVKAGERCVNPNGSLFQPGMHSARRYRGRVHQGHAPEDAPAEARPAGVPTHDMGSDVG